MYLLKVDQTLNKKKLMVLRNKTKTLIIQSVYALPQLRNINIILSSFQVQEVLLKLLIMVTLFLTQKNFKKEEK